MAFPKLQVTKSQLVALHPILPEPKSSKTVHLSILDATVAKFATTSAVWFYPPVPCGRQNTISAFSTDRLKFSLQHTITSYPWLSGQLHWAHSPDTPFASTTHEKRFRRLAITYSANTDPGALYAEASCNSHDLADLITAPDKRPPEWDPSATGWAMNHFLPNLNLLAFHNFPRQEVEGSCFAVQITKFKCGGTALGVAFSHQIADAIVMSGFMHNWSRAHDALMQGNTLPDMSPLFEPDLLDKMATGDIDSSSPDVAIVARARQLPMLRYDYWVDGAGETVDDRLPQELRDRKDMNIPRDTPIPWSDWDRRPASLRLLHFDSQEIDAMYSAATDALQATFSQSSPSISRHDIVLAHVWQCINTARRSILKAKPETEVILTMTLGTRARLSLPTSFIGSPLLITHISRPAGTFQSIEASGVVVNGDNETHQLSQISADICRTQRLFNAETIGDALHDAAFEVCPHRLWQTMLGSRHTLSTSWIHTRVYEDVSFGCDGLIPWYVHASVEKMDGLLVVLEARLNPDEKRANKWYHSGVDVSVALQSDVMDNMLAGGLLRRWRRHP